MFDTNIFNRILDGNIDTIDLPEGWYCVSQWQEAEIRKTKDPTRRSALLGIFETVSNDIGIDKEPSLSTPWGSPWGSPWHSGGELCNLILKKLASSDQNNRGHAADAVNIEVCHYKEIVFVSNDRLACEVAKEFGVQSLAFEDFIAQKV